MLVLVDVWAAGSVERHAKLSAVLNGRRQYPVRLL